MKRLRLCLFRLFQVFELEDTPRRNLVLVNIRKYPVNVFPMYASNNEKYFYPKLFILFLESPVGCIF
jgi:hypothetical protein